MLIGYYIFRKKAFFTNFLIKFLYLAKRIKIIEDYYKDNLFFKFSLILKILKINLVDNSNTIVILYLNS